MSSNTLISRSGLLTMGGGLVWSSAFIHQWTANPEQPEAWYFLAPLLWFWGLLGLYALGTSGLLAKVGLVLAIIGTTLVSLGLFVLGWFGDSPAALPLLPGILALAFGIGLFGIANLGDRVLRRWNGIPLVMVLLLTGWMIESPRWMPLLLMTFFGLGWVLLGYELWRGTPHEGLRR